MGPKKKRLRLLSLRAIKRKKSLISVDLKMKMIPLLVKINKIQKKVMRNKLFGYAHKNYF